MEEDRCYTLTYEFFVLYSSITHIYFVTMHIPWNRKFEKRGQIGINDSWVFCKLTAFDVGRLQQKCIVGKGDIQSKLHKLAVF